MQTQTYYTIEFRAHGWSKARLQKFRKRHLQQLCAFHNFETDGTVKVLKERLINGDKCVIQISGDEQFSDLVFIAMCKEWQYDSGHLFWLLIGPRSNSISNYCGMPGSSEINYPELGKKGSTKLNKMGLQKGCLYRMDYDLSNTTEVEMIILKIEELPENHIDASTCWTEYGERSIEAKVLEHCKNPERSNPYEALDLPY